MLSLQATEFSERCDALRSPNPWAVSLAAFLIVGILISYIPQHLKIISRRSSEGLSPWWVLLGSLSSIAAIGNILVLPASRADIRCCKELDGSSCAAALLGVAQIGCQWACFMFIVMLFFIFFPTFDLSDSVASLGSTAPTKRRDAVIVGGTTLFAVMIVFITSVALVAAWPRHTQTWANILGLVAGLLAAVQYIPQIYYTYIIKDVKSLSLTTMVIQAPGAFLFAFSLYLRVGPEGWSTWMVYIVTGVLQGALFALGVHYQLRNRHMQDDVVNEEDEGEASVEGITSTVGDETEQINERTALLRGSQKRGMVRRESTTNRTLDMLYAATPPDEDSDTEAAFKSRSVRKKK
ncbi:hypothetical protein AMS68_004558 [Peltaster fructicola]|uniref:PQ loop repeat protein n=1 Tax=Peltaster fructicola TaxID=286661 RepID=A0A6H0XWK3_9PEZI|nr:hypothetical protein AMS68_004558 [Peltaster fructicola]